MPNPYTGADAIGLYYTVAPGAEAAGVAASLGGARSGIEVSGLEGWITDGVMPSIAVEKIGTSTGTEGDATLGADDPDEMTYTPAGGTAGAAVEVLEGGCKSVTSASASNYIRVSRDSDTALDAYGAIDDGSGRATLEVRKPFGSLLSVLLEALGNRTENAYAAGMVYNQSDDAVAGVKIYVGTLGTQRLSGTAQLGGSGGGTIDTATADGFADWPESGGCRIETSGGTLKEIVYYSSRTSTSLTVASAGRALLDTSATAGAGTDKIYPVPLIRIGLETPDSEGLIQTVADATTEPTGITWSTAITAGTGLSVDLDIAAKAGLWIHRYIPPSATTARRVENVIALEFGGYTQKYFGLYCICRTTPKYNVYVGVDAAPDFTAPDSVETSLPISVALTLPVSGATTYNVCVRAVDALEVEARNSLYRSFTIDSAGALVGADIGEPYAATLADEASGYVRLRARYTMGIDADPADTFIYYVRTDGTDPDPGTDTGIEAEMRIGDGLSGDRILNVLLGPYAYSTDVRVIVHTKRSSDDEESVNTDVLQATVATVIPAPPGCMAVGIPGAHFYGGAVALDASRVNLTEDETTYLIILPGATELWNGDGLALRLLLGGIDSPGVYTPFTFVEDLISGAGTGEPLEVADAHTIYLCVGGVRRVKIDTTAREITANSFTGIGAISNASPGGPTLAAPTYSALQVFDPRRGAWRSAFTVDASGDVQTNNLFERTS